MKAAEWKRTVRPLIPVGERWEFRGPLCYRAPTGRLLFGVLGEGSGFDTGIYVWRVAMPLYVPADVIVLDYSERVGGGSRKYDADDPEVLQSELTRGFEGLPHEADELRRNDQP